MVLGRAQRPEPAGGQVGGGPDAEIRAVHMRVRSGAEGVAFLERDRYVRRMTVPVGDGDGTEDDIPARVGVFELAPQPAGRHHGVGVRGSQPDRGRIVPAVEPQQFSHPGRPRGADAAGLDADHPGAPGPGHRGRPVAAAIGDHQQSGPARCSALAVRRSAARQAGSSVSSSWAGDHAGAASPGPAAHTRPVAWATDTGVPSVRIQTSARKSGSAWRTRRASPGCVREHRCTSSPDRG